ncbi:MAG: VWA domain-containing protein [Microscillaceae bacterium]|nr:VWA domain-containing protein [Microscillaceae bacterium]
MAIGDFSVETPENYEQKCLCVLTLDVSGSMVGDPIRELNRGLQEFRYQIIKNETAAERLEVSIITFANEVKCIQEPALIKNFQMPTLEANGSTQLARGIREAILKVISRKMWYRKTGQPYYRPFIILITDGEPDADQDLEELMLEINEGVNKKRFLFYPVGVENANMDVLRHITHPAAPPMKLKGLNFMEFFQWLSNSVGVITRSQEGEIIRLPDAGHWGQIAI